GPDRRAARAARRPRRRAQGRAPRADPPRGRASAGALPARSRRRGGRAAYCGAVARLRPARRRRAARPARRASGAAGTTAGRRRPIRREAARLLARCQLEAGDAGGAQRTAAQWLAFDPLDVDARLALHAALAAQPERRQDAAALARDLFALAPDQEHLLLPHLRACLAAGDEAAAAQAFVAHLAAGGTPAGEPVDRGFVLQRDDGDGFEPLRAEPLQIERAGDRLALSFAPPLGTRRLRLQFPPRAAFTWHDVRIRVATAAGTQEVALPDLARLTAG